jgi:hypothetical protein
MSTERIGQFLEKLQGEGAGELKLFWLRFRNAMTDNVISACTFFCFVCLPPQLGLERRGCCLLQLHLITTQIKRRSKSNIKQKLSFKWSKIVFIAVTEEGSKWEAFHF